MPSGTLDTVLSTPRDFELAKFYFSAIEQERVPDGVLAALSNEHFYKLSDESVLLGDGVVVFTGASQTDKDKVVTDFREAAAEYFRKKYEPFYRNDGTWVQAPKKAR